MEHPPRRPALPLGRIVATPGVLREVDSADLAQALSRHAACDWGLVDADDGAANDDALLHGARLLSIYEASGGVRFWVITEADRSSTTALLPDEY